MKREWLYIIIIVALTWVAVYLAFRHPEEDKRLESLKQRGDSLQVLYDSSGKIIDSLIQQGALKFAEIQRVKNSLDSIKKKHDKNRIVIRGLDADSSIGFLATALSDTTDNR